MNFSSSPGWLSDTRKNLEERALTCSIAPYDANNFSGLYFKRDVIERPKLPGLEVVDTELEGTAADPFPFEKAERTRLNGARATSVITSRSAL
jgi:hypothetical protein